MVDPHNIEGCEDLLESYFMQVSGGSHSLLAVSCRPPGQSAGTSCRWLTAHCFMCLTWKHEGHPA